MSIAKIRKRRLFNLVFIAIGLGLLVSGCTSIPGHQKALKFNDSLMDEPGCVTASVDKACRNKYIDWYVIQSSKNFSKFVRGLTKEKNTSGLITDSLRTGLDAAIVVVTGAGPKTALGAASIGLAGLQGSIDKRLFYEATVPALIKFMDARRSEILVEIMKGRKLDTNTYPISLAIRDLQRFNDAGSITDALNAVQEEGAKRANAAQKTVDNLKISGAPPKKDIIRQKNALSAFLGRSGHMDLAALRSYASEVGIKGSENMSQLAILTTLGPILLIIKNTEQLTPFLKPFDAGGSLSNKSEILEHYFLQYDYVEDLEDYMETKAALNDDLFAAIVPMAQCWTVASKLGVNQRTPRAIRNDINTKAFASNKNDLSICSKLLATALAR